MSQVTYEDKTVRDRLQHALSHVWPWSRFASYRRQLGQWWQHWTESQDTIRELDKQVHTQLGHLDACNERLNCLSQHIHDAQRHLRKAKCMCLDSADLDEANGEPDKEDK